MTRPLPAALVAALVGLASWQLAAQQQGAPPAPAAQQPVFRTGTRTVMVPASVTDETGQIVRDLTRDDFEIRDNGKPQPITVFDRDIQAITAILLLDGSASMLSLLDEQIAAANEFILRLLPGDRLRLGSFAEDVRIMPGYTGDRDELLAYLENEFNIRLGRRTRLWDAMDQAIVDLGKQEGRRVLIVISDGVDTWSLRDYDAVRVRAGRNDVAITFGRVLQFNNAGQQIELCRGGDGSSAGRIRQMPRDAFQSLAWETGGALVPLRPDLQMDAPFTQIALDLHGQYMLGFEPAVLDGKEHTLDVRVKRPRLEVRARRKYIASER